jgi:hydrogenase maturation protease
VHDSVVVIGVGNALRGDDAAGLEVARRLADLELESKIKVRAHEGEGVALLDLWDGADAVLIVDTVRSNRAPGTLLRIDATSSALPLTLRCSSSHTIGIAEAIELARALGTLPPTVVVYGVEGASFEAGEELSLRVAAAIDQLADNVRLQACALIAPSPPG